jgi:hypothetical protein
MDAGMLQSTVRIPDHVMIRRFVQETVVLNLETGQYHGLNSSAGRMLEVLQERGSVAAAAARLAEEYSQPLEEMERGLCKFCADLAERQLIEVDEPERR